MLLRLLDWILGYVVIEVTGKHVEQFMNLCAVYKKDVWGFSVYPGGLKAMSRLSEVKGLRKLARKAKVRIHIREKHGVWFTTKPIRKRWGLLLGVGLFCCVIWLLGGRIWCIDIQGNTSITTQQIEQILNDSGVTQGVITKKYDWATLRQTIITEHPEISWLSFNPQGCVLKVDLSETTVSPELQNQQEPRNLVASRDGRIVDLQVFTGNATVKKGDAVVKGDMLISGVVEYSNGCTVFKQASGVVMAETIHKKSIFVPFEQKIFEPTGEKRKRRVLCCFGWEFPFYLGSVSPPYEKDTVEKFLTVGKTKLPLGVKTAVFHSIIPKLIRFNQEEVQQQGKEIIQKEIEQEFDEKQLKNVKYTHQVTNEGVETKCEIFCVENIIFQEKLLIF